MRKYTKYISISFISIGLFLPIAVLFYAPTTSEAILWYTSFNVTGNPNIYRNMNVGQVQQLRAVDSSGVDITSSVNWGTNTPSIVSVSNGLVRAIGVGKGEITAYISWGSRNNVPFNVSPATVDQTPTPNDINLGPSLGTTGTSGSSNTGGGNGDYVFLAPLPIGDNHGLLNKISTTNGLGAYLNPMIKIFIALCAVLSVIMIVVGGIEYMTSELAHSKEDGKNRIMQAILGLLIALGSWALLNTINPDLLNSEFNPDAVTSTVPNQSTGGTCSNPQFTNEKDCINNDADATWNTTNQPAIQHDTEFEP